MKKLNSHDVRQMWLDFFQSKGHYFLEPVSLIPVDDPSLLWINSGVATLKPYFDGRQTPPAFRLTNSQKSIRTNDIENVGVTARHQTMFEMLGNFSIGDYFKKEAIHFAWELLTSADWFAIDPEKLYITVFEDDADAYNVWTKEIGIQPDHIFKGTRETNFWDVGQGPCGPNSEIFFDRGLEWDPENIGTRLLADDMENDRYIEIWNIVFSQFNNDGKNNYTELPRKNIDTGAGLERLVSIFQNAPTNFETDLFLPTIQHVQAMVQDPELHYHLTGYQQLSKAEMKINTCYKVIADHIRAVTFAISDGVYPGNKDRGYIIRRLIRRSTVYGRKLGINDAFLYQLVDDVIAAMSGFYTYLTEKRETVIAAVKQEEERFLKTLSKGSELLENLIKTAKIISGKDALLLFESYGFPIELTLEMAAENDVEVDLDGFNRLLDDVKEISRNARKDDMAWNKQSEILTKLTVPSEFVGYDVEETDAKVAYMFWNDIELKETKADEVLVVLDKTPFYAEKGGQAADIGHLYLNNDILSVLNTQQGPRHQHLHHVYLNGNTLKVGDTVKAEIDHEKRFYTMKNHSGTHILHAAIREVLGTTAMQAGSFNNEAGLRIDITFNRQITPDEIKQIQAVIDREIKAATPREVYNVSMDDAVNKYHALAFFTEKYDEIVRVVKFGDFSSELCGGTHVENTADIEQLLITGIESKGSGIYRFTALTSFKTITGYLNQEFTKLRSDTATIISKYNETKAELKSATLEKQYLAITNMSISIENLTQLKGLLNEFKTEFKQYQKQATDIVATKNIAPYIDLAPKDGKIFAEVTLSMNEMKMLGDVLKNKHDNLIVILFNPTDKTVIVTVSDAIAKTNSALDILKGIQEFNVKGGGNNTLAQGKIITEK
jgi:alanyl-tRNA synthetase